MPPQDPDLYAEFKRRLVDRSAAQPLAGNKVKVLQRYFEFDSSEVRQCCRIPKWNFSQHRALAAAREAVNFTK